MINPKIEEISTNSNIRNCLDPDSNKQTENKMMK